MDGTGLAAGFVGPAGIGRIISAWRRAAALRSTRIAVFVSNRAIYGLTACSQGVSAREAEGRVSVFTDRAAAMAWLLEV
jgi:hypothetical protein